MNARSSSIRSDINITPLIDIVLVLLIVFIIMVPVMHKVMEAAIPAADGGGATKPQNPLVVTLDAQGRLLLQQTPVDQGALADQLVPALLKQPIQLRKVFLKVDGERSHAQVVSVMDLLRQADERVRAESQRRHGLEGPELKVVLGRAKAD